MLSRALIFPCKNLEIETPAVDIFSQPFVFCARIEKTMLDGPPIKPIPQVGTYITLIHTTICGESASYSWVPLNAHLKGVTGSARFEWC